MKAIPLSRWNGNHFSIMSSASQRFRTDDKKTPLIIEFQIAVQVYELTRIKHQQVWFNRLVEVMKGRASRQRVAVAVDNLLQWGILVGEFHGIRKKLMVNQDVVKAIRIMRMLEKELQKRGI